MRSLFSCLGTEDTGRLMAWLTTEFSSFFTVAVVARLAGVEAAEVEPCGTEGT